MWTVWTVLRAVKTDSGYCVCIMCITAAWWCEDCSWEEVVQCGDEAVLGWTDGLIYLQGQRPDRLVHILPNGLDAGWLEVSSSSAKRVGSEAGLRFISIFIHAPANAHSLYNIINHPYIRRGSQWRSWLSHCATRSLKFFIDLIVGALWRWGRLGF